MKKGGLLTGVALIVFGMVSVGFCAYHHEGEMDADTFLSVYPDKKGTKLDHCALCHSGGQYERNGQMVSLGSCQWCHYSYGYDASGDISDTMNPYGQAYHDSGRSVNAVRAIENEDSDGDGYGNLVEIQANRFPGNALDDPSKVPAPYRLYTRAQLEAMSQHTQFLLMNTSRSGDFYAEYTGVPIEDLLQDAGILATATGITVYAPDGWSQYHPLHEDLTQPEFYQVNGTYPSSDFYYDPEADTALNPVDGWCDYSAPSCQGRNHLDPIAIPGGLKTILAYKRKGGYMDPGILNQDNKLDGEGPFRVVPPQKNPGPPDQSSRADNQAVIWPYDYDADHNAGAATRTVTIIKVEPLPAGTTDIDVLEAGWAYVDQGKIVIYGAINGDDVNGNGIPDSEEGTGDFDGDGILDNEDRNTACLRHSKGIGKVKLQTSKGEFQDVEALNEDDPAVPQVNRPAVSCPYGTVQFKITGLNLGETVTIGLAFPGPVATNYRYYKIDTTNGWHEIPFGSNDGDNEITLTLTDGDPQTDADGQADGTIVDPGAIANPAPTPASGGGGSCFISTLFDGF